MKLIARQLAKKDHQAYKKLFDEDYYEYLEALRQSNLQRPQKRTLGGCPHFPSKT
jgi:hypothetical protein